MIQLHLYARDYRHLLCQYEYTISVRLGNSDRCASVPGIGGIYWSHKGRITGLFMAKTR